MTADYLPGERWLVVTASGLAYLEGTATDALGMWRVLGDGAGILAAADVLVRAAMQDPGGTLGRLPPFVLAMSEPAGLRVLCREIDQVAVRATGDGDDGGEASVVRVPGAGVLGWAEVLVPHPCELTIGDAGPEVLLPVPGGVVRAAAVRWAAGGPAAGPTSPGSEPPPPSAALAPPAATPPPPSWEPADRAIEETRFELVVEAGDGSSTAAASIASDDAPLISAVPPAASGAEPGRAGSTGLADPGGDHDGLTQLAEDLPIGYTPPPMGQEIPPGAVLAVLCPSGHANAPHTSTCRLCGQPIGMTDPVPVQRPVLARIRVSTGEVVDLDRPVVLGRAPFAGRVAASELPRLITVPSPNQDVSRAHVRIRAADWQLVVADLDSTNGTTVRPPGRAPVRLHPGQEMVVEPGWSVDLGDGVSFVIEAAP